MTELVETTGHPPLLAPSPEGRRRARRVPRWVAVVAVAVAAVAAALAVALTRGGSRDAPAPASTVELPTVSGNAIEVPPSFRQSAGIATERAVRGPLTPIVTVVGEAAFDPTLVAAVGTRAPGIVRKVHFVEGSAVEKGEILAEIESPGLAEAEADKRIAEAKKRAAELNAERERSLFERRLTTAREYEQSRAQLAEQRALHVAAAERVAALGGGGGGGISQLRAPVAGIVAERSIAPGQSVGPGLVAFRVGSLDRLWIVLRVFERHLQALRAGDEVEIRPVASPERAIPGKVAHVGGVIDPSTHTADVRVEVDNTDRRLRPGQAVRATIRASGPARVALSVPASAVVLVDGAPTVFVAETPTRFVAREVELGIDGGDRLEITSGIAEGEEVVSRSVLAVKSELFR